MQGASPPPGYVPPGCHVAARCRHVAARCPPALVLTWLGSLSSWHRRAATAPDPAVPAWPGSGATRGWAPSKPPHIVLEACERREGGGRAGQGGGVGAARSVAGGGGPRGTLAAALVVAAGLGCKPAAGRTSQLPGPTRECRQGRGIIGNRESGGAVGAAGRATRHVAAAVPGWQVGHVQPAQPAAGYARRLVTTPTNGVQGRT